MCQILFQIKKLKIGWLLIIGSCLTVSCGPLYDTKYSLTPPSTIHGQTCVSQCEIAKNQCEQIEELSETICEVRNAICDISLDCFGYPYVCIPNYERCDNHYVNCYETCGGKVEREKVCVMGCE